MTLKRPEARQRLHLSAGAPCVGAGASLRARGRALRRRRRRVERGSAARGGSPRATRDGAVDGGRVKRPGCQISMGKSHPHKSTQFLVRKLPARHADRLEANGLEIRTCISGLPPLPRGMGLPACQLVSAHVLRCTCHAYLPSCLMRRQAHAIRAHCDLFQPKPR